MTDADVNPQLLSFPFPGKEVPAEVHGGFYRNVRATRYALIAAIQRALQQHSLYDHGPQNYVAALTPPEVHTEFGN